MSVVRFVRLHVDDKGVSHMNPQAIPIEPSGFAPPAPPMGVSSMEPAEGWRFLQLPVGWAGDWHPSPVRMSISSLPGRWSSSRATEPRFGWRLEVPCFWKTQLARDTAVG